MAGHDERRRLPRRRTRASAAVVFGDPVQTLTATIRDRTDLGAKLLVEEADRAPDLFEIIELKTGALLGARVVWRAAPFIGVVFTGQHMLKGAADPRLIKLSQLWVRLSAK
jgi:hypothetical protein